MNAIQKLRLQTGNTQSDLAEMAGTSQSTIAAYETGAKSPTLRTIENLAQSQNLELLVMYMPRMTREDRRSLAFHRAIIEIIRKDPAIHISRARRNLKKLCKMHPGAQKLFRQWLNWMALPFHEFELKILDPLPDAREMRQVSPFSGVLSAEQRVQVLRKFRKDSKL